MLSNNFKKVVFYVPVQQKYLSQWEYYCVDQRMLEVTFDEVIITSNFWKFLQAVISKKPDLVYFWWWHKSLLVVLFSSIFGIKCIGTGAVHMYDESGAKDFFTKSFLYRLTNRLTWRLASATLFISMSQFRQITSHEFVQNPLMLKSSTLQTVAELNENTSRLDRKSKKIRLMTICWLTKDQLMRKSIIVLLKAIKRLPEDILKNTHLTIIGGNGDAVGELQRFILQAELSPNVTLLIDAENETKIQTYQATDLYFQPSTYEGFGNSVLEAMTYGTPAIVSGLTAQPEVVKDSGYILREISEECISEIIIEYHGLTAAARQKLRSKTLEVVRTEHSFDRRLRDFQAIIEDLK